MITPERIAQIRQAPHGPDIDAMLDEIEAGRKEIFRLRQSVRNQCGDNLCHLTDGIPAQIPPWSEFQESCHRYHSQISGEHGELRGCMTIAQLEAENEQLRTQHRMGLEAVTAMQSRAKEAEELVVRLRWDLDTLRVEYLEAREDQRSRNDRP